MRRAHAGRAALAICLLGLPAAAVAGDSVRRGEYLFRAAGCAACHTAEEPGAAPLAGGRALRTPFGTFFTPNITPDGETGIGRWTDADFVRALRHGRAPDGRHYYPAFPYTSYTEMRRADMLDLKAYLFSLPAVSQPRRPHELVWYARGRWLQGLWKSLNFRAGEYAPRIDRDATWNRGAYLVRALAHCGQCHTPRGRSGGLDQRRVHAGTRQGPEGKSVPNITPHRKTGIGAWTENDLVDYLESGVTPAGDVAGGLMAEVIDEGLKYLREADRRAIAKYLLSLPPIDHAVAREVEKRPKEDWE